MFRIFCQNKTISRHRKQPFQICILLRSINASTIFREPPPFAARCICLPLHIIMHYAKSTHLPAHLHYKTHSTLSIDAKLDFYHIYAISRCLVDGLCVKNVRALSLYCALYIWCTSTLSSTKTSWLNPQNIRKTEVALSSELCLPWWVRTGASSGSWFAVCLYNRSRCKATIPEFIYTMLLVSMHTPTADLCSALICMQNFGAEFMYTLLLNEQHVNFVKCAAMHIYIYFGSVRNGSSLYFGCAKTALAEGLSLENVIYRLQSQQ